MKGFKDAIELHPNLCINYEINLIIFAQKSLAF